MLGRFRSAVLICAVAWTAAVPACAGERGKGRDADGVPILAADVRAAVVAVPVLSLLLEDTSATFSAAPPPAMVRLPQVQDYTLRGERSASAERIDVAAFEEMDAAQPAYRPFGLSRAAAPAALSATVSLYPGWDQRIIAPPSEIATRNAGRDAVRDSLSWITRRRPPRMLDTSFNLLLDGNPKSPVFSVGGGVAATIWQAIPKN